MEDRMPMSGEFYRHFKGKIYQIKMIAKDSETEKLQVVYQGMYPPFQYWVRPLEEFLSPVDLRKYPDARQKMRFLRISADELEAHGATAAARSIAATHQSSANATAVHPSAAANPVAKTEEIDDAALVRALTSGCPEKYLPKNLTDREIAERGCMQILDAETYHEKRQLMVGMKPYLDKRLLHNIAAALDIVLEEGDLDSQYDSLLHCLDTMKHFEGGRLR
ncbi:MAG: DUF1653 domain-containing protein [Lachnospiraceae bacterium]|nr:DUF1653 domain-containing protein [Lachnospiraceae bacterium]